MSVVYDVIIVGAGVAGSSAAYHLEQQQQYDGGDGNININILVIDEGREAGEGPSSQSSSSQRHSGSATMPSNVAPCVKMMVQLYATDSDTFVKHHGVVGAKRYLEATGEGLQLQKHIANELAAATAKSETDDSNPNNRLITEMGSFYVATEQDEEALRKEYDFLKSLQIETLDGIEWYDRDKLQKVDGCCCSAAADGSSNTFHCAIFFPRDAIIDSSGYAKQIMNHCCRQRRSNNNVVTFRTSCKVIDVREEEEDDDDDDDDVVVVVELASGETLKAKHAVLATGGLFQTKTLCGLLKPCYSYLVHVPIDGPAYHCETSSNFFTWGYTHDWCFTNGAVRVSGEDHFSALKDPKTKERCQNLADWTRTQYGCALLPILTEEGQQQRIPYQHGVYSETPDHVPLIGTLHENNSKICYLLGCNAWGQTILSYCGSLVPGLLGFRELSMSERDKLELFSIRRFTELLKKKDLIRKPKQNEGEEVNKIAAACEEDDELNPSINHTHTRARAQHMN